MLKYLGYLIPPCWYEVSDVLFLKGEEQESSRYWPVGGVYIVGSSDEVGTVTLKPSLPAQK
jgi:hypothetical protein